MLLQNYQVAFYGAGRNQYGHQEDQLDVKVSLDGGSSFTQIFTRNWQNGLTRPFVLYYTNVFVPTSDTVIVRFINTSPSGDRTVFVDGVRLIGDFVDGSFEAIANACCDDASDTFGYGLYGPASQHWYDLISISIPLPTRFKTSKEP